MTKSVKITPDGKILEVTEEEENSSKKGRVWDGKSLLVPEHWSNNRKFRLTLTFPDLYEDSDTFNPLATMLLYNFRYPKFKNDRRYLRHSLPVKRDPDGDNRLHHRRFKVHRANPRNQE